jgi:hypothetical protein
LGWNRRSLSRRYKAHPSQPEESLPISFDYLYGAILFDLDKSAAADRNIPGTRMNWEQRNTIPVVKSQECADFQWNRLILKRLDRELYGTAAVWQCRCCM